MKRTTIMISAGVGPFEARQFVALLSLRILRICRSEGRLEVASVERQGTERHAPHSVSIHLEGDARAALADELGTHALVSRSDRRSRRSRKRWFASVAVLGVPDASEKDPVEMNIGDVALSTARARGPGGQHVNKTNSAVRALHLSTGISVRVDNERSQIAKKRCAIAQILQELQRRRQSELAASQKASRLTHYRLERGDPVRVYRLNHRNELEVRHER